ncbi:MAG: hypothetical protein KAY06_11985, partial [Aeromonadaceae bacterium]|nr:hypothetical protein [Aeromonadaceae bacterium]
RRNGLNRLIQGIYGRKNRLKQAKNEMTESAGKNFPAYSHLPYATADRTILFLCRSCKEHFYPAIADIKRHWRRIYPEKTSGKATMGQDLRGEAVIRWRKQKNTIKSNGYEITI